MVDFVYKDRYGWSDFIELVRILRSPGGCPWDREQTHASIRANLLEEAYEAAEAIDTNDAALLCEELGDCLAQIVMHSDMSAENGGFDIDDVIDGVCKKYIVRHPHVFGEVTVKSVGEVLTNWDDIKKQTKGQESHTAVLESVSVALPALTRAVKLSSKAVKAGYAVQTDEPKRSESEWGELLFSLAAAAKAQGIDPEAALADACKRFIGAFSGWERAQ